MAPPPHALSEKAPRRLFTTNKKEAEMARVLTLSALYVVTLGTFFGAYALTF